LALLLKKRLLELEVTNEIQITCFIVMAIYIVKNVKIGILVNGWSVGESFQMSLKKLIFYF
jgi:hypothetical protein